MNLTGDDMDKRLDLYAVVAERETGFWITLPVRTRHTVSREEWLRMRQHDPDHFQFIEFAPDSQLPLYSECIDDIVEHALSVRWSDETLQ